MFLTKNVLGTVQVTQAKETKMDVTDLAPRFSHLKKQTSTPDPNSTRNSIENSLQAT